MKRRINYTGRKRIERERFSITLVRRNGSVVSFHLDKLDLKGLGLPDDAKVYIEAYYRTELKRFDFGTVGNITPPPSTDFTGMAYTENLKFRILVVDPRDYKILAHADRITLEKPSEGDSILEVSFDDLDNEVWCIKYEGDEGAPILCLNKKIPNIQKIAKEQAQFFSHIYPAVLREILIHMIFIEGIESLKEPTVEWHDRWLKFAENLLGSPPSEILIEPESNKKEVLEWIEDVVKAFCDKHASKFEEYTQQMEEV